MLSVEIKINGRLLVELTAVNVSPLSTQRAKYKCQARSLETGQFVTGYVLHFDRQDGACALAARLLELFADDNLAPPA